MKELILIPSYKPNKQLPKFLDALKEEGLEDVLIVDDGSEKNDEHNSIYEYITKNYPKCEIIYHAVNLGKGRAIKTGFNYVLNKYPDINGVVACDADGQHPASSVSQAAKALKEHPDKLILGIRKFFKGKNVPFSNFLGNMITILIFKILTGLSFGDTQCGLRAFPKSVMEKFIATGGERFEYENIMLLDVRKEKIDYAEFPMEAIYHNEDEHVSHFNKLKDSVLIYLNILKFSLLPILAGLLSYAATILIFMFFPRCSLIKSALFYAAGSLIGWVILLIPISDDNGKWYTMLFPIIHTAVLSVLFYWLFNYIPILFHGAWWLSAILAAPSAYAIYLRLRYGKKPKRFKI